jgi:hypothetical protein
MLRSRANIGSFVQTFRLRRHRYLLNRQRALLSLGYRHLGSRHSWSLLHISLESLISF